MSSISTVEHVPVSIAQVLAPIHTDMEALNHVIQRSLHSEITLIQQISQYLIEAGGKRVRPALLFLISNALKGTTPVPHRHEIAAVLEFIHTATLLHDDVVDESDLRRGRKTVNSVFGNPASVLVGDFLYSRAFQMMVVPGDMRIMEILSSATNVIAEGEVLQLLNLNDSQVTEDRYFKVIMYKTAKLFEASAELGALLAQASTQQIHAAKEFGTLIGTVFQLIDDWLDYASDAQTMGKNMGDDLREGKPTLPLIFLLQKGSPRQRQMASKAIDQTEEMDDTFYDGVLAEIHASGALDYTLKRAQEVAQQARDCLSSFPKNGYTQSLYHLCDYSLARIA